MPYYVYILKCSDDTYYTGSTNDLSTRVEQHQQGADPTSYTASRRPVQLVWSEEVPTFHEALTHEHQIKGWTRAKKEALIREAWDEVHRIVQEERVTRERQKRLASAQERANKKAAP